MFGRLPTGPLRQLVREQAVPVTVTPPTDADPSYGTAEMDTENAQQVPLVLYEPDSAPSFVPDGVVTTGQLNGLCLADDVPEDGARIDYGTGRYELMSTREVPRTGQTVAYSLTFEPVGAE